MQPVIRPIVLWTCVAVTLAFSSAAGAATLKVSSFPAGALVSIDGVATGKITPMSIALPEGPHTVVVEIPNSAWKSETRVVTVGPGTTDVNVALVPTAAPAPTAPTVTTFPAAAWYEQQPWYLLQGSQDYGALEVICQSSIYNQFVDVWLRIRNTSAGNHVYVVASSQLRELYGSYLESYQVVHEPLTTGNSALLRRLEFLPTLQYFAYDFTVLRYANGADEHRVFSSAHVSIGFDMSTEGVCRVSTVTRVD